MPDNFTTLRDLTAKLTPARRAVFGCCVGEHAAALFEGGTRSTSQELLDAAWRLVAGEVSDEELDRRLPEFLGGVPTLEDRFTPGEELRMKSGVALATAMDCVRRPGDPGMAVSATMALLDALLSAQLLCTPSLRLEFELIDRIDSREHVPEPLVTGWHRVLSVLSRLAAGGYDLAELRMEQAGLAAQVGRAFFVPP